MKNALLSLSTKFIRKVTFESHQGISLKYPNESNWNTSVLAIRESAKLEHNSIFVSYFTCVCGNNRNILLKCSCWLEN